MTKTSIYTENGPVLTHKRTTVTSLAIVVIGLVALLFMIGNDSVNDAGVPYDNELNGVQKTMIEEDINTLRAAQTQTEWDMRCKQWETNPDGMKGTPEFSAFLASYGLTIQQSDAAANIIIDACEVGKI